MHEQIIHPIICPPTNNLNHLQPNLILERLIPHTIITRIKPLHIFKHIPDSLTQRTETVDKSIELLLSSVDLWRLLTIRVILLVVYLCLLIGFYDIVFHNGLIELPGDE